jgi:uncharacterized membrane protein
MTHATQAPQVQASSSGRVLSILGFVFGAIAVLFLPIVFGPAGIVCAGIAVAKGDRLGKPALAVAIGGMILGFILGAVVFAASN